MQPSLPYAWACWSAAGVVGVIGIAVLILALFRDRSRGRRRCGRCWYDMSATPGTRCPECGRDARIERRLFRTRRRWKWAVAAVILLGSGITLGIIPYALSPAWWLHAPTPVLIALSLGEPGTNKDNIEGSIRSRLDRTRLSVWEKQWIASRVAAHLRKYPITAQQHRALNLLRGVGADGAEAIPEVTPLLNDPDLITRVLAWGAFGGIAHRDPEALRRLNAMLTDPEAELILRARAVNRMEYAGAEAFGTVPSLIQIIERPELHADNNGILAGAAAYALGHIGPGAAEALPALRTLAADTAHPPDRRYAAMLAIALITRDADTSLRYHVRMLKHSDIEWRRQASNHLYSYDIAINGLEAIVPLLGAIQDPDPAVQGNSRAALAMMIADDPRATTALKRIAGGTDAGLAAIARETLEHGGDPGIVGFVLSPAPATASPPTASPP